MRTLGYIGFVSARLNEPGMLAQLKRLASERDWVEDDGFKYVVFKDAQDLCLWPTAPEDIDIALSDVTSEIRTHVHRKTDVIVVAYLEDGAKGEAYIEGHGWAKIVNGQVFPIKPGEVHGFRKTYDTGRLLLVSVESPGIAEDDTEPVDVDQLAAETVSA